MTYQLRRISDREGFGKTPSVIIIRRQSTIIGRASSKTPPDCVIESQVNPMMVSRKHAEVRAEEKGNRYFLVDHSLNGTYINYTRILSSKLLVVGDIICFGHVNGYNIKPGSTVSGFRSELKFVFEKVSNSPGGGGPTGPTAPSGDQKSSSLQIGDAGRKRQSGGVEPGGSRSAASSAKRPREKSPPIVDSSMSSSQSSPSRDDDLPPSLAPHQAQQHAPAPPMASAPRSSFGGSVKKSSAGGGDGKKSDSKKSSASAKRQSSVDSGSKGGSLLSAASRSKSSAGGGGGSGKSSKSRPSKQSKQSRGNGSSRHSGMSSAAATAPSSATIGDASGQFHIDGEPCESLTCIKPKDPNVNWVCCDSCNSWYHVMCTDLDDDVNLDDIEFFCIKCRD